MGAITNSAALNILGLWLHTRTYSGKILGVELTGLEGVHIAKEFLKVAAPVCSSKSAVLDLSALDVQDKDLVLLTSPLPATWILQIIFSSSVEQLEVISLCSPINFVK